MAYVNVGVTNLAGSDIPTKAALKQAIAADPASVVVYGTAYLGDIPSGPVSELGKSDKYQVTGPNPYNNRKWYATVSFNAKTGKWTVA